MKCATPSGRHRWKEWLGHNEIFRAWNAQLAKDPTLRICCYCGARAHIDSQGRTVEAETRSSGEISPVTRLD